MKQRIILHLTMFVVLMPCMLVFNFSKEWWINFIGLVHCCYLVILLNESERAQRFLQRYYREIRRLESMM